MRRRINLFALAVTLVGAALMAQSRPLSATLAPSVIGIQYCCVAKTLGSTPVSCCGDNWCGITAGGCASG